MKHVMMLTFAVLFTLGLGAEPSPRKVLHIYDEENEYSPAYLGYFREAYADQGIEYRPVTIAELKEADLHAYDTLVIHAMVMAFAMKSPVRDWLRTQPALTGKRTYLLVSANRWFLDKLYGQLTGLLDGKAELDAVSMATKELDEAAKKAVVQALAARIR